MQFIEQIAYCVIKHAPSYAIAVHSPVIAQAVLESASGTSELAVNANNFLGIKYRPGRCPTSTGIYYKVGSEQSIDGSYASSVMKWCKFDSMEDCIIGYFDFINISRYANLKGVTDPEEYLNLLKADGYATSLKYVENVMNVIKKYDLTKYDRKEVPVMSNSPLVSYTKLSPNKTSPRNHVIDTITIHCVVGQLTAEGICNCFTSPSRKASCNYGIGHDGKIALVVDEKDRSWCSSNAANDHRAVTIEVASDKTHPYTVTWEAYESLIKLCADICKRNGIKELLWRGDKSLIGQVDKQNMTVHRWFANKSCPGDYLYNKHPEIAAEVNRRLSGGNAGIEEEDEDMTLETFKKLMNEYRAELRDNDCGSWSKEAREWAIATGLFAGGDPLPDGTPNYMWADMPSREQIAQLFYRFAQRNGLT